MNIAERKAHVKKRLKRAKKSQNALAIELGISRPYLSQILSGKRRPSLPLAFELERALGIPAIEFAEVA